MPISLARAAKISCVLGGRRAGHREARQIALHVGDEARDAGLREVLR